MRGESKRKPTAKRKGKAQTRKTATNQISDKDFMNELRHNAFKALGIHI